MGVKKRIFDGVSDRFCVRPICVGRDSSVGTATPYGFDGAGWNADEGEFCRTVHTGCEADPACCTVGTGSLSRG